MRKLYFNESAKRKMRKGFLWVQYAIFDDKRLNSSDKVVYMALARFANNETQEARPSMPKLIKTTGLVENTVRKSIKQLERFGYIEISKETGKVNYYQLNDPQNILSSDNDFDTPPQILQGSSQPAKTFNTPSNKGVRPPQNKGTNNTNTTILNNNDITKENFQLISEIEGLPKKDHLEILKDGEEQGDGSLYKIAMNFAKMFSDIENKNFYIKLVKEFAENNALTELEIIANTIKTDQKMEGKIKSEKKVFTAKAKERSKQIGICEWFWNKNKEKKI